MPISFAVAENKNSIPDRARNTYFKTSRFSKTKGLEICLALQLNVYADRRNLDVLIEIRAFLTILQVDRFLIDDFAVILGFAVAFFGTGRQGADPENENQTNQ